MTYNKYMAIIGFSGFLAWVGFLLILFKLNPFVSSGVSLTLFFATLFVALSSTLAVLGFYFRVWLFKNEVFYQHINIALRQGVVLSLIVIFSLVFQMLRVLNWWSGFLLIAAALLLEFYFASRDF